MLDYILVDIGGNYDLSCSIKLGFGVYNLFDKEIIEVEYGYVEDGCCYWLLVGFNF